MRIRCGFEIGFDCPAQTPMLLNLSVHPSRRDDLESSDRLATDPRCEVGQYIDAFGNLGARLVAPAGRITLSSDFVIRDGGLLDEVDHAAAEVPVRDLPGEVLVYLLGSRYCETDRLGDMAWALFGRSPPGWARVQAVVDFVHGHIGFDYQQASRTRGAFEAWEGRVGVCRDFTHLAVAFCRCLNIPARYCTGYLGDIRTVDHGVMDFAAWMEVYLGGRWWTFDPRNNERRIGRILMARGRDAADVALANTFGRADLTGFTVISEEIGPPVLAVQGRF
jgi:transglutaminase-like putative cysteine protease